MLLCNNKFFKHRFYPEDVIKCYIDCSGHLRVRLISGNKIHGMDGCNDFMIATSIRSNDWSTIINDWATLNLYENFVPHKISNSESIAFINSARKSISKNNTRLGQEIMILLGNNTTTPNPEIFNSNDDAEVLKWFYDQHVE